MPKHLEKRRRRWYAVLEIPKDLREHFGRPRFFQSLQTDSQREAERLVGPVVALWRSRIAAARNEDPHERELQIYRMALERADDHEDTREALTFAMVDYAEAMEREHGHEKAKLWHGRASGEKTDLRRLSEEWLAGSEYEDKSLTMHRQAMRLLLERHQVAETVNRRSAAVFVKEVLSPGRTPATVNRMITTYSKLWGWLQDQGHVGEEAANPWSRQRLAVGRKRRRGINEDTQTRRAFTEDEAGKMVAAVDADAEKYPADPLAVRIMAVTGMRIEEVCSLAHGHVEAHKGIVWLHARRGKTAAAVRSVPVVNRDVMALLSERLRSHEGAAGDPFFPEYAANSYGDRYNALSKRLGRRLRGFSKDPELTQAHSWRHRAKGLLERAGVRHAVQDTFLGHSLPGEGATYYNATNEELRKAAKALRLPDAIPAA